MASEKRFTFFFPGLRLLSNAEIESLPPEKRQAASATGRPGVWLEVPCPKDACIQGEGKVCIDALPVEHEKDRGVWLKIFCPEDSCLFKGGTDLP